MCPPSSVPYSAWRIASFHSASPLPKVGLARKGKRGRTHTSLEHREARPQIVATMIGAHARAPRYNSHLSLRWRRVFLSHGREAFAFQLRTSFRAMYHFFSSPISGARGESLQPTAAREQPRRRPGLHLAALHHLSVGQNCAGHLRGDLLPVEHRRPRQTWTGGLHDYAVHREGRLVLALSPRLQLLGQLRHLHLERYCRVSEKRREGSERQSGP